MKLRTIVLLAEMDDGVVYQAMLSELQESAVKSVIAALPEPLNLREDPLSLTLEHPKNKKIQKDQPPTKLRIRRRGDE